MAKELPYFKFEPAVYLTGSIQFCSLEAQGLFSNICCLYWQRECQLTHDQLLKRFEYKTLIDELVKENIIKIENNSIIIDFLVKQFEEITNTKLALSEAGRKGGLSSAKARLEAKPKHKIREDEIKEDKEKKEDIFTPPTSFDVLSYFVQNGYTPETGLKAYQYYSNLNWKDSKGKQIANWKNKMVSVWFKPENKIKPKMVY